MNSDLTLAVVWAVVGCVPVVWVLVSLTRRLREERAVQAPRDRSRLSVLIAGGIGAFLLAYFAFGESLQALMRLALVGLAIASFSAVRRFLL